MKKNQIKEINNEILRITQSVVVHTPKYSKFGGYEGENDIYTMDIAKALYNADYRKQTDTAREIFADIEEAINNKGYFDELVFIKLQMKYAEGGANNEKPVL